MAEAGSTGEWANYLAHLADETHQFTIRISELAGVLQEANTRMKNRRPERSVVDVFWSRLEGECCTCGLGYDGRVLVEASAAQSVGGVAVQGTTRAAVIEAFSAGRCVKCGTGELRLVYHGDRPIVVGSESMPEPEPEPVSDELREQIVGELAQFFIDHADDDYDPEREERERQERRKQHLQGQKIIRRLFVLLLLAVVALVTYSALNPR